MVMTRLYECIKQKQINNSEAREAIYTVLMQADNCLSVADISKALQTQYYKKVSLNTIYRHLTLFVECGLAIVIQDDFKKAYYTLTREEALAFTLCPKCNAVSILENTDSLQEMLLMLKKSEFITVHKICAKCKRLSK